MIAAVMIMLAAIFVALLWIGLHLNRIALSLVSICAAMWKKEREREFQNTVSAWRDDT